MKKVKVYELAKEVGMDSKVLATKLQELGYNVKSYQSALDEDVAEDIRTRLTAATHKEVQEKRIQTQGRQTIIRRRTTSVTVLETEGVAGAQPQAEAVEPAVHEPVEPETEPAGEIGGEGKHPAGAAVVRRRPASAAVEGQEEIQASTMEAAAPGPESVVAEEAVATEEVPAMEAAQEAEVREEAVATEGPGETPAGEPSQVEAAGEPVAAPPAEPAGEPEKKVVPVEPRRTGLARVIGRAAIYIPQEDTERQGARRPGGAPGGRPSGAPGGPGRPAAGRPARSFETVPTALPAVGEAADDASGKGKKGKRFVKFHHEAEKAKKGTPVRRKGFDIVDAEDVAMAGGRLSSGLRLDRGIRGVGKKQKKAVDQEIKETKAIKKRIKIHETITIADLAHRMGVKATEVIAMLMKLGVMATVNQSLDVDTATLVATDFGYELEQAATEESTMSSIEEGESGGEMLPRPPVVTVMGHVDHGKTSILDAIRNTDVAAGEAGGITQHIGAHYVRHEKGDVVFLDTPGHEAFTEMRSRGAKITDVVVLVVAADDGVMDQTKEAINHAKAAEVPIVVAVNKIDKPEADPMRVKRELAEFGLVPEEWGGQTIYCETSAKKNIGIDSLLEQILLQAEILELKADPKRRARGRVVEAHLHKGRGAVATILVQQGTLWPGDAFVVGHHYGKVRSLFNDKGALIKEAGPSTPVEVHGLSGVPNAGDEFMVVPDERVAKHVSNERQMKSRESQLGSITKISLDNLFDKLQEGTVKELRILLRTDVQGTLEAFGNALEKLSTGEVRVKILHQGTGAIIDSDVLLAAASEAIIIGFNVRPNAKVADFAKAENVDIRYYDVIYHALDDIRKAMVGMLEPTFQEKALGSVEVRNTFTVPKVGTIAGCYVTNGKIERNANVRLVRDGVVVYTGRIGSLKRFKDDAREVLSGYECGVGLENFNDIKVGDILEIYVMEKIEAQL